MTVTWGLSLAPSLTGQSLFDIGPGDLPLAIAAWACVMLSILAMVEIGGEGERPRPTWRPPVPHSAADFVACVTACVTAAVLEGASLWLVSGEGLSWRDWGLALRMSLVLGVVVFLGITFIRGVASLRQVPASGEAVLTIGAGVAAAAAFIYAELLASLSWQGAGAAVAAVVGAAALVLAAVARPLARRAHPDDGVATVIGGLAPAPAAAVRTVVAWVVACGGVMWLSQRLSHAGDWNFLVARLGVAPAGVGLLAAAMRTIRLSRGLPLPLLFGLSVLTLTAHAAIARSSLAGLPRLHSTRWMVSRLAPAATGLDELFAVLPKHTNIPASVAVSPVELRWAVLEGAPAATRPHIFVFVIDSLRRDYLSPYNKAVTFTPSIAAFARESRVFEQAFTQYGATGLSVPSIWVGGPVLHKQYVTPFGPMNTLAHLLAHEQYAQWIGTDNVMEAILPAARRRRALDADVAGKDLRLCRTLDEVRGRLASPAARDAPVFVYSLPQDIHVSAVSREGGQTDRPAGLPGVLRARRLAGTSA